MKYSFSLIPESEDLDFIISLQNILIKKYPDIKPVLQKKTNIPHITLIQGIFSSEFDQQKTINKIYKDLGILTEKLVLNLEKLIIKDGKWLFLKIKENPILTKMHNLTFDLTKNFLTKGDIKHDISLYTPNEEKYFKKYGYRYIKEAYLPHFTLGSSPKILTDKDLKICNDLLSSCLEEKSSIVIDDLVFNQMGEFGSCLGENLVRQNIST